MKKLATPSAKTPAQGSAEVQAQSPGLDATNDVANAELAAAGPSVSGLENYQDALGTWLGTELYEAVSPHLTLESVQGYADDLAGSILGELGNMAEGLDGTATDEQVQAFMKAIEARVGPMASDYVQSHGAGLVQSLSGWVDANPELVVATALLAAAGAVLADVDVPTLRHRLEITDELTAEVSAKLGSLRNIGLEQIKASLQYTSGPLVAAMSATYGEEEGVSAEARVRYGDDNDFILGTATSAESTGLGTLSFRGQTELDSGLSLSGYGAATTDGDWTAGLGGEYESERIKAEIDAAFSPVTFRLSGSGEALVEAQDDYVVGGDFVLGNDRLLDLGLYAGFRDRDEFRSYLGRYAYESGTDKHSFGIMVEEKLGPIYGRLEATHSWSALGTSLETAATGAHFFTDDTALLGGIRYNQDHNGDGSFTPGVGMQIDDKALMLEYDPQNEAVMLNFTIPFGR